MFTFIPTTTITFVKWLISYNNNKTVIIINICDKIITI